MHNILQDQQRNGVVQKAHRKNRSIHLSRAWLITKANNLELHVVVLSFNSEVFKHFLGLHHLKVDVNKIFEALLSRKQII